MFQYYLLWQGSIPLHTHKDIAHTTSKHGQETEFILNRLNSSPWSEAKWYRSQHTCFVICVPLEFLHLLLPKSS